MPENNKQIVRILNSSSFATQTFADMKQICKPFLKKFDFSAFEYARVYDEGTAIILYSDPSIANYVVSKELHISAHVNKDIVSNEFWFIPDQNGPYSQQAKDIKEISQSSSFCNYIRRYQGYYEMYCFWTSQEQDVASNKFINMKEILEQYTLHFGEQAKKLITLVDKDRFQLTDAMLPNFKGLEPKEQISINLEFYLAKIQYELVKLGSFISPSLSPQELKCITLLIQGKTATDIANMLCLSNRTVEMHLNSIKNKLNCRKKSDIIGALINLAAAKSDK